MHGYLKPNETNPLGSSAESKICTLAPCPKSLHARGREPKTTEPVNGAAMLATVIVQAFEVELLSVYAKKRYTSGVA